MIHVYSNTVYLIEPGAKSRARGLYYLLHYKNRKLKGPAYFLSIIIKAVISSVAESELGALSLNATNIVSIRNILLDIGHQHPPMPIKTDNTTVLGVVTNNIMGKHTKDMDMRFY